jgi:hypothetical protein
MKVLSIQFKNFGSYGNKVQTIKFSDISNDLFLVAAGNGFGKCVHPDTEIELKIEDEIVLNEFKKYLNSINK